GPVALSKTEAWTPPVAGVRDPAYDGEGSAISRKTSTSGKTVDRGPMHRPSADWRLRRERDWGGTDVSRGASPRLSAQRSLSPWYRPRRHRASDGDAMTLVGF